MRELEKILEEIENQKTKHLDALKVAIDVRVCDIHRERYKGLCIAENIIRKHLSGKDKDVLASDDWIPVEEDPPKTDDYILLSFANFSLPLVGRYESNEEGGAFYLGDCDEEDTCISQDLYVNAWRPLPAPYRPETNNEN